MKSQYYNSKSKIAYPISEIESAIVWYSRDIELKEYGRYIVSHTEEEAAAYGNITPSLFDITGDYKESADWINFITNKTKNIIRIEFKDSNIEDIIIIFDKIIQMEEFIKNLENNRNFIF